MLAPQEIVDTYFLEARCMALELGALLDRYDAAVKRCGSPAQDDWKLNRLRQGLSHLAFGDTPMPRTEVLLELFAAP
jgi:hypothetical protein